jgi:hypothetical protein
MLMLPSMSADTDQATGAVHDGDSSILADAALADFPGADVDFSSWFNSVNLDDLLGELPVSSEDPFGFGTDWGGWQT